MKLANIALSLALISHAAPMMAGSAESASALAFFEKSVKLGDAYDSKIANLYSDNAVIRTYRRYPHGLERSMTLSGTQWKALLIKTMPLAKAQADKSSYSNIKVTSAGNKSTIRANRYSERKCYTDTGYYMVIQKQSNGDYLVVEEYTETQPQSNCKP